MPREWQHFVDDMLAAISMLGEAVEGKTLEAYKRYVVLRFATQRAVEIISEASRSLPEEAR
jgi:uncharacterized protein with HEPN domain